MSNHLAPTLNIMRLDGLPLAPIDEVGYWPEHVRRVVAQLVADSSVREVWLIGSQVNGTASPTSDWDLLVFASREPVTREERCPGVDVLWKGPTQTRLEGQAESQQIDFGNFRWSEGNDRTASYVGYKLVQFEYGVSRDASISPVLRPSLRGLRIWATPKRGDASDIQDA